MEATLHDLVGILLKAIPTLVLLLIVHLYLKWMFFGPLREVLAKRRAATEGAREAAQALLVKASERAAAIEAELRNARSEIYQEQEEARRRWTAEQTARLDEARQQSREVIREAKQALDTEAAVVKREISATTADLADQIARSLLERKSV